jgi:hypothetical protein
VWWLYSLVLLATSFGLFALSAQARGVFALLILFNLLTSALGGVYAAGPLVSVTGVVLGLMQGATLALSYLSALAGRFR